MAKRITWQKGNLVSLRLRDDLFTIGQMLTSPAMRFYDIRDARGEWENIDLNQVRPLFRVFIGKDVLQQLVDRIISSKSVRPSDLPEERLWIKPNLNYDGGFPFRGGRLIEVDPESGKGSAASPTVKDNLTVQNDRELIEKHELTNMWGAADIRQRLSQFFDTGLDEDSVKRKVFPDLPERRNA